MRHFLLATTLVLAGCASPNAGPAPVPSATYSFHAVGKTVAGMVVEELFGEARVYDNEIRIVVQRGVAEFRETSTRRPIGLSAGLAYQHPNGGWDFRKQSPTVPLGTLEIHGDSLVSPVEFRLTGTRGLDLTAHWIVIQQHRYSLAAEDGLWHEATRPIDSDRDVFKSTGR